KDSGRRSLEGNRIRHGGRRKHCVMTATSSIQPFEARQAARGAFRRIRGMSVVAAGCLAAGIGATLFVPTLAAPLPQVQVSETIRQQMPSMSTGANQALVVEGERAQDRNAQIPVAAGALAVLSGFDDIPVASPHYGVALKCLTQAVYYEAANEPTLGKRAVAQVVLNRLRHPAYPNSVCGVVYEGASAPVCQFSFTCDGSLLRAPM